ncbi:MAG TPA: hypothetical protein VER03_14880 [Bryobacteraceae bacterium]|nr:hypothetical protein [Bryobacteraceae bacterium]
MLNDRLLMVGVAALSAVATAGWMRQTPTVAAAPQATNFTAPVLEPEPALPVQSASFNGSQGSVYHQPARSSSVRRVASNYGEPQLRTRPRVYDDRRANRAVYDDRGVVTQRRSGAKSAAIIGGSAAAGAAVGAMAGGGKGAAIGALAGGAGGYVYDRATKNKEVESPYRSSSSSIYDDDRRNERSTKERVAIIGGGAAAGAAIGGLAGGGKGAAIGAITGGAGGYIYDRVTKNR